MAALPRRPGCRQYGRATCDVRADDRGSRGRTALGATARSGGVTLADTTGTHSVYTTVDDFEIMFHVSTLLPFKPRDLQQVRSMLITRVRPPPRRSGTKRPTDRPVWRVREGLAFVLSSNESATLATTSASLSTATEPAPRLFRSRPT